MSNGVFGFGKCPRVEGVAIVGELTSVVTDVEADGGSVEAGEWLSNESGARMASKTSGAN